VVECPSLGTLKRLRIGHDNSGVSPGWFLDKVIVDDLETHRVYEFPCHRWLAKDEDDGQISRELLCGGAGSEGALNRASQATEFISHQLCKGKVFPYSLPSVGPGADPGVQAVSPQVT